jgi:cellulose biosynthesis protein BcsQ
VAVSGPKGGTGKTTVALNLAVSLARQGFSVALVDGSTHGDIVMATDGGAKARAGVFDVLAGRASLDEALVSTSLRGLSVIYAVGPTLPEPEVLQGDHSAAWKTVLGQVAARFDVVLVDTPGGMLGATQQILAAASHVLGVLQAEVLSQRSMTMFRYALEALPRERRPEVLGILINMVQVRHGISLDVLKELGESLPPRWLLETTLPRNPAFLDATRAGLPLRLVDHQHPPSVAWLFDALASEVTERLMLIPADAPRGSQPLFSSS